LLQKVDAASKGFAAAQLMKGNAESRWWGIDVKLGWGESTGDFTLDVSSDVDKAI